MNTKQLCEYIYNYLKNDKSQTAIMLKGPWGSGKSYFIRNELKPRLNKNRKSCIVVSLYGLQSINEVNKNLYFEVRASFLNHDSKFATTGKIVAKTVLKSAIGSFGINFDFSDEDMEKLYKSVNLKDKLIVFEDIERTNINIIEFLGYVNNLIEQDNVKVMLVANEDALIKREKIENNNEIIDTYTPETEEYLRQKEKTIGDTICFHCDYSSAIKNILNKYNNLKEYCDDENIKEIKEIIKLNSNLRSFNYTSQKVSEIYDAISDMEEMKDTDFIKCIFYGTLHFVVKSKENNNLNWDGDLFSLTLGNEKYPLFRFCFDYIMNQDIDIAQIIDSAKQLKNYRSFRYVNWAEEPDLSVIYNYYIHTEKDLRKSINNIQNRLSNNTVNFGYYERLIQNLVVIKHNLHINIDECKKLMLKNLNGKGDDIPVSWFLVMADGYDGNIYDELKQFKLQAIKSLKAKPSFDFTYEPNQISYIEAYVKDKKEYIGSTGSFANRFVIPKLVDLLKKCNPEQIHRLKLLFAHIYQGITVFREDEEALKCLNKELENLLFYDKYDKVQLLQIKCFKNTIEEYLLKLKSLQNV